MDDVQYAVIDAWKTEVFRGTELECANFVLGKRMKFVNQSGRQKGMEYKFKKVKDESEETERK